MLTQPTELLATVTTYHNAQRGQLPRDLELLLKKLCKMNLGDREKEKFEHYVPQFYLRRFANNPKQCNKHTSKCRLTVFDKFLSRKLGLPVNRAAGEGGFYKEPFEGTLEAYETEAGPIIKSIVKAEDCQSLSEHEKDIFAKFIAIQDARTQTVRSVIEESHNEIRRTKGGTTIPNDGTGTFVQRNLLEAF